jgi:DNA polymerase-4
MSMLDALERCPHAKAIKTDLKRYREVSLLFKACLRSVVDSIEPSGLGAAYLDGSHAEGGSEALATRLVEKVRSELALSLRVGIATRKFLARLAAEEAGGEGVLRVPAGGETAFLRPRAVGCLPGVGPRTVARLAALGAHRVGDLLEIDPAELEKELGNHGLRILEFARGEDDSRIRAARHPQTLGQESTFDEEQLDMSVLWERLQQLAQGLEERLRQQHLSARQVSVKVRYFDQETSTRRRTQPRALSTAADIFSAATKLLDRTHAGSRPIRLLGITLAGLARIGDEDSQLDLFDPHS